MFAIIRLSVAGPDYDGMTNRVFSHRGCRDGTGDVGMKK